MYCFFQEQTFIPDYCAFNVDRKRLQTRIFPQIHGFFFHFQRQVFFHFRLIACFQIYARMIPTCKLSAICKTLRDKWVTREIGMDSCYLAVVEGCAFYGISNRGKRWATVYYSTVWQHLSLSLAQVDPGFTSPRHGKETCEMAWVCEKSSKDQRYLSGVKDRNICVTQTYLPCASVSSAW